MCRLARSLAPPLRRGFHLVIRDAHKGRAPKRTQRLTIVERALERALRETRMLACQRFGSSSLALFDGLHQGAMMFDGDESLGIALGDVGPAEDERAGRGEGQCDDPFD